MKIALCITDLDVGGAERCFLELATRLDRRRFDPVVYCLGPRPQNDEASCVPGLESSGIKVYCLGARGSRDLWRVFCELKRLLRNQSPDLLQCFLFHANLLGRLAGRQASIPRIVSGIRVAQRRGRWRLWVDWATSRWVDQYVCVSQAVARFCHEEAGLPSGKLTVIPNGIETTRYPPPHPADLQTFGVQPHREIVTYVGRLDPQKGLPWLLQTATLWLPQVPQFDLLLVGEGPERPTLERLATRPDLSGRIFFAGWQPDVPAILRASRLLVLPSRWEGMPNVVLEAMASRLPVLATDAEGVRELLGPNVDDQSVAYGDTKAFSEKIVRILSDPQAARILGEANRLRAEEHFTYSAMVEAYESLWESLLDAP